MSEQEAPIVEVVDAVDYGDPVFHDFWLNPSAPFETSPSDIAIFELCPRKWAWRVIDGIVPTKTKAAYLGIEIHRIIEKWLRRREFDRRQEGGAVAEQIIRYLPPPQAVDPRWIEAHVAFSLGGIIFNLTLDVFLESARPPRVYDHKSTSDFCWALTPEDMHADVQVSLYAAWALVHSKAESVEVQWTYGRTRGAAAAQPVVRELRGVDVRERVGKSIETARLMKLVRDEFKSARDVPYNASACENFGGCPFRGLCNLSPEEQMEAIMSQEREGFLNALKSRNNGVNPPAGAAPAPAVAQQYAPPQYAPPQPQQQYASPQQPAQYAPPPQQPPQYAPPPQPQQQYAPPQPQQQYAPPPQPAPQLPQPAVVQPPPYSAPTFQPPQYQAPQPPAQYVAPQAPPQFAPPPQPAPQPQPAFARPASQSVSLDDRWLDRWATIASGALAAGKDPVTAAGMASEVVREAQKLSK